MRIDVIVIASGALALSAVLTGVVLRLASRHGLLDVPNERSSHTAPTARGGGIAVVIASAVALLLLGIRGAVEPALIVALLLGVPGLDAAGDRIAKAHPQRGHLR